MKTHTNRISLAIKKIFLLGCSVPLLSLGTHAYANDIGSDIAKMFSEGSAHLALRYRLEEVQQDNFLRDATASTLRARISLQSAKVNRFSIAIEADSIMTLGADHYDSFALDRYRGTHSVIADPVGTEINVALAQFDFTQNSKATFGRQRLNHGQQRFLGSVGWRQNEQTMDAFSVQHSADNVQIDYSYIWNVNRIFAGSQESAQLSDLESDSHALLISNTQDWGSLSGFVYALDFDNALAASSLSYGLSYTGMIKAVKLYASYARQSDYGNNPVDYSTDYFIVEGSGKLGPINLLLGYESLGSDDGRAAFSTPLATLHRYQGSADIFLNTPANGLQDRYVTVSTALDQLNVSASFHEYQAERGGLEYGSEWNLQLAYPLNQQLNVQAKYAHYEADNFAVDTDKLWLSLNMAF